jgi:hypothetical protein
MKAELRYLHSPDINDLENYLPENPDNFCVLIQALIGPSKDKGEEAFDFLVCTPKWISNEVEKEEFILGKDHIVIKKYNYGYIFKIISELCNRISGDDWNAVAYKLGHYGRWEFDDYQSE